VTGVDISEDMLMVARERIAAITPEQLTVGANLQAEFVSLPVQQLDFEDYFDAAILYDAMHHFDDEVTTLSAIARSPVPGGRIYIHEGIRPRPGSKGERELIEEMEQYGTLEAPFDPDYLMDVVARSGFVHLRRLVEVDHLMPADQPARGGFGISRQLRSPSTNTIIGSTPMVGDGRDLSADLTLNESVIDDGRLVMSITARNAGSHRWSAAVDGHPVAGSVNVAPFLGSGDARRELPRVALPEAVDPGESMTIQFTLHLAALEGETDIGIDLVREQVAWFSDRGGTPLRVSVNG
jgi:SAM-dependent methyltransferase